MRIATKQKTGPIEVEIKTHKNAVFFALGRFRRARKTAHKHNYGVHAERLRVVVAFRPHAVQNERGDVGRQLSLRNSTGPTTDKRSESNESLVAFSFFFFFFFEFAYRSTYNRKSQSY